MKYVSILADGTPHAALLEGDTVIPLEGINEIGPETSVDRLATARPLTDRALPVDQVRLRPLVPSPTKVLCVGLNYKAHIEETKRDDSAYPVLFPKFASNLIGPNDSILLPQESGQIDYEGELAVIIGRPGRRISEENALDHILGYASANDVTVRDFQYKTHQWLQGKAWDGTTPLGPAIVTADEFDTDSAGISTVLNGEKVQQSDLGKLIFSIPRLISVISTFTQLVPGDVILTGTPGGVGYRREPKLFLKDGDTVTVSIEGIGSITNRVEQEPPH